MFPGYEPYAGTMSRSRLEPARSVEMPRIVAVAPGSPAARAGLLPGDEVVAIDGRSPRDVLEWRLLVDDADPALEVRRGGLDVLVEVPKRAGEALGAEVHSSWFDRFRTCDNHCEFCSSTSCRRACVGRCT